MIFSYKVSGERRLVKGAKLRGEQEVSTKKLRLYTLLPVIALANQVVGDGVADLFLILGILSCEDM